MPDQDKPASNTPSRAMMSQTHAYRYAIYLIPPYPVAIQVAEVHELLRKQFGFIAAGKFQVHATIKGFFKMTGALESLTERLDGVFAAQQAFLVHIGGYRIDDGGIGLNIAEIDGAPNQALLELRARVVEATRPAIAPDCDFSAYDLGAPFEAHITLAFRDISPDMHADVLDYLAQAPLPQGNFAANTFHMLAFDCDDWKSDWAPSLRWRLLKSWQLLDSQAL